jgi:uncharacterized protein YndB with AHSA1/START domain
MTVKKEADGHRSVAAEIEVPGAPEEVWRAIATGPGISAWFVPTTCEEREGGQTVSSFGPGMDAIGIIKRWDPPRIMEVESETGEGGPGKVATQWLVEARSGDTCVVRVVHRWFADSDQWDGEFEGHAYGWVSSFFRILKLYLADFAGQPCTAIDLAAFSSLSGRETWGEIKGGMQFESDGRQFRSTSGAPVLAGQLESTDVDDPALLRARERAPQVVAALEGMDNEDPQLLLRLVQPAPGVAHFFIMNLGHQVLVTLRFFLYGEQAERAAQGIEQGWRAWLDARFSPQPLTPES